MGVSGAGKTTVGELLGAALGACFVDADDLHSPESRAKMAAGIPLDEADRAPWLQALAAKIDDWLQQQADVVLACSALRAAHRAVLRRDPTRVAFVYLHITPALAHERLLARRGHFFTADLLDSQLRTLEPPSDAVAVDASRPPGVLVEEVKAALAHRRPAGA